MENTNKQYRDLFDQLEIWTGLKINNIFDAWIVADTIIIEGLYNINPSWASPSVMTQLEQFPALSLYQVFSFPETNKIRGGPLVRDIMENIRNLIANKTDGRKGKIYSGHDITVAAVLSFLGVNYIHQPPYASALLLDLYHLADDNSYALKVEYLNSTDSRTTQPMQLPRILLALSDTIITF
ncbi:unnamed protein product [Rotaria sp. Silwood2]|nr:unnamed protein product [Rotaria sp. Silwood2]